MTAPTDETPQTDDWWDRLYAEANTAVAAPAVPSRAVFSRTGDSRLPDWWVEKSDDNLPGTDEDQEPEQHEEDSVLAAADDDTGGGPGDNPELSDDASELQERSGRRWLRSEPGYWPSLRSLPARPAISDGTKKLVYNASAGALGYIHGPTEMVGGWIESCGREYSIAAALVLGSGICLLTAVLWDSRTRHWYPGLAWLARIPLASTLTALALYAPASQL
ncbi:MULTISPECIES: hypothetical protein [Streptomyces]|uniref:Uncharacterized protein n=1 Tax=Streptomyces tsukubensis (strain DSM 42081 / NBRC 108919 / NRRL 18488 / 9993) TaxID=1114943 RepID=I2MT29_STRT9|nr:MULTISPECIES: hypothetical protein [Streptomyces]AZK98791.1 hypothetical protein B7R87_33050 [Streptomyces tsukubensis]EIF87926.1 hypothetical protein [Streptomyces tsukubensis NRRL18488]MYS65138.1 hypothetical protein [Streptomyces sp. SID5473]QKM65781.1 hypothetical protein STSU_000055 [Streptomyces tsukubensis NRRL18488]